MADIFRKEKKNMSFTVFLQTKEQLNQNLKKSYIYSCKEYVVKIS